ncbi:MAG: hypothetical protein GY799_30510 [Desulfobulbaceae bacterium]|nr:hypothetical protein [Desulfobulbaceae bacterium]
MVFGLIILGIAAVAVAATALYLALNEAEKDAEKNCSDKPIGAAKQKCPIAVSVKIDGCKFIPKSKSGKYKAIGSHGAGTYNWTASGKISIVGSSSGEEVEVTGDSRSNSIDDSTLKVAYSAGGGKAADSFKITVFEIEKIKITVKPTPANTVRAGFVAPADHEEIITSDSKDFATNTPVVLMHCATRVVALKAIAHPPNLPLQWHRERNPADHANLGSASDLPNIVSGAGGNSKGQLTLNQKGSFHILPFVACKGDATFDATHTSVCLNLVLAHASVRRDRSRARTTNLSVNTTANTMLRIINGAWGPAPLSAATLSSAGMAMELVSDVTGGGADGRLGLDQVFCGLINNVLIRGVNFHYRDTTVVPPANRRIRLIAVSNPTDAHGNDPTWGTYFATGNNAPVLHALPLLDSGLRPAGIGGDTALMTRSQADSSTRVNQPVGQRWTTRCIDSPGTPGSRTHRENANAVLRQIDYQYQFKAAFCFWTNRNKTRNQSGHVADRTYAVLRKYDWEIRGVWDVTWPAGSRATLTVTTAHTIRSFNQQTTSPVERAQDHSIEVRPPSGVSAGLSWDAQ